MMAVGRGEGRVLRRVRCAYLADGLPGPGLRLRPWPCRPDKPVHPAHPAIAGSRRAIGGCWMRRHLLNTAQNLAMHHKRGRHQAGITLLEMMIVLVIVAILVAVAYPSYQDHIVRSNRAVGASTLLEVAARQEQFFANNASYASTTVQMGYPAAYHVDRDGEQGTAATSIYLITVANVSSAPALDYTLTATPQNWQTRDTDCGNLTLNDRGVKGQSGAGERCWE